MAETPERIRIHKVEPDEEEMVLEEPSSVSSEGEEDMNSASSEEESVILDIKQEKESKDQAANNQEEEYLSVAESEIDNDEDMPKNSDTVVAVVEQRNPDPVNLSTLVPVAMELGKSGGLSTIPPNSVRPDTVMYKTLLEERNKAPALLPPLRYSDPELEEEEDLLSKRHVICAVPFCRNKSKSSGFFTLPLEEKRRNKWLQLIGRNDILLKSVANQCALNSWMVCDRHFKPEEFKHESKKGKPLVRKLLIKDVYPSQYLPLVKVLFEPPTQKTTNVPQVSVPAIVDTDTVAMKGGNSRFVPVSKKMVEHKMRVIAGSVGTQPPTQLVGEVDTDEVNEETPKTYKNSRRKQQLTVRKDPDTIEKETIRAAADHKRKLARKYTKPTVSVKFGSDRRPIIHVVDEKPEELELQYPKLTKHKVGNESEHQPRPITLCKVGQPFTVNGMPVELSDGQSVTESELRQIVALKAMVKSLTETVEQVKKEKRKLCHKVSHLRRRKVSKQVKANIIHEALHPYFTKKQIHCITTGRWQQNNWDIDDAKRSLAIIGMSNRRVYKYLKDARILPLPSLRTLDALVEKHNIDRSQYFIKALERSYSQTNRNPTIKKKKKVVAKKKKKQKQEIVEEEQQQVEISVQETAQAISTIDAGDIKFEYHQVMQPSSEQQNYYEQQPTQVFTQQYYEQFQPGPSTTIVHYRQ